MTATLLLLSLPIAAFAHDVLVVVGVVFAVIAGLLFINLGLLMPGLLTGLGGYVGRPSADYREFGPGVAPVISEPAPVPAQGRDCAGGGTDAQVMVTALRRRHLSLARSRSETGHAR